MKILALALFFPLSAHACEIESAQILARVLTDSTYVYGGHCPVEVQLEKSWQHFACPIRGLQNRFSLVMQPINGACPLAGDEVSGVLEKSYPAAHGAGEQLFLDGSWYPASR